MLLVPSEFSDTPNSQPHWTIHWPENEFELPETCCGISVPELRMTMVPVPLSAPIKLKARLTEMPPPPPLAPWEMYDWEATWILPVRSEEHTSELQSLAYLVCRLLLEKKKE